MRQERARRMGQHLPRPVRALVAQRRAPHRPVAEFRHPRRGRSTRADLDGGARPRHAPQRKRAAPRVEPHRPVEEPRLPHRQEPPRSRRARWPCRRYCFARWPPVGAVRDASARALRRRLRRSPVARPRAVREHRRREEALSSAVSLPAHRRVPRHQPVAARHHQAALWPTRQRRRRRRRRPSHLRFPRRRRAGHLGLRPELHALHHRQARRELPLDRQHPRRRQRRHQAQHAAQRKNAAHERWARCAGGDLGHSRRPSRSRRRVRPHRLSRARGHQAGRHRHPLSRGAAESAV